MAFLSSAVPFLKFTCPSPGSIINYQQKDERRIPDDQKGTD
jgi:hypothetical protein